MLWMWLWAGVARAEEPWVTPPAVHQEALEDGSVRIVPDRQVPASATPATDVLLEFGETSLFDLTLYFADLMRKNFLLSDEAALRGKSVRLIGHEQMTVDEAWQAFRSALRAHGFTTSETDEVVTIVATGEAARGPMDIGRGPPAPGQGFTTRLLPVDNARVGDLVAVITPLLSADAEVVAYAPANTLIVTDVASNVRKVHELVVQLDIAAPASHLQLVRLEHAPAAEVRAVLEALYPTEDAARPSEPPPKKHTRGKAAPAPNSTTTGAETRHISKILDDERTNSLIVLANPQGHAAVAEIVAELDVEVDLRERSQLHILHLKYAMAEEVEQVLTALQQDARASADRPGPRKAAPEEPPDVAAALDGTARFAADPATNAIAVVAEPLDYEAIAALVAELDVARGQVFVDAVFVELTSSGGKEIAASAHLLPSEGQPGLASAQLDPEGTLSSFSVSPDLLSGLAAGVFGPLVEVATTEGIVSVPLFGIALRALQTSSDVQVMDNPGLLTVDHEEATLSVGRRIPYTTTNQISAAGTPIQTYERVDVNMELTVTPHINDSELVTLDVELTVDEVEGDSTESGLAGGPVTSGRNVKSRVMVEDGQTIVIATLAGTKLEVIESKIPILGDIPLIGMLFRGRTRQTRRTELMVFLTPHVVDRPSDLLEIRRIKEAQRQEFVRRFQGKQGQDFLRELEALLDPLAEPAS